MLAVNLAIFFIYCGIPMFKPNFKYTDKIVKNLINITESKVIILNTPLIPKWEVDLKKEAILRSAHFSTAIEGNSLTFNQVNDLADGKNVIAQNKDKQEVLNYLSTLRRIPEFSKNTFNLEILLEIHKSLTKNTLEYFEHEGSLRNQPVYVVGSGGKIVFTPPKTEDVLFLINEFFDWLNSVNFDDINPVIVAGLAHYELVRIHPFIDGNGRTARVLATLILYKSGFDINRFFALDDYYDMNRKDYYNALQTVDPNTLDLTKWLEYFTEGIVFNIESFKDKVIGLNKNVKILKEKDQIDLDERQIAIIEKISDVGKITNMDIREMFSISDVTARKESAKLEKLGIIERKGKGRNVHYILI